MRYELYYWPDIQGRGEFIRLALEDAGASYRDMARLSGDGKGVEAMLKLIEDNKTRPPFAPPFLKAGKLIIAQTANILYFLGPRLGLVAQSEVKQLWALQLQLTIADFISEVHDTHHPISGNLYFDDQKAEAHRRTRHFLNERIPKFLTYFDLLIEANSKSKYYITGRKCSYVDLSLFQVMAGLNYAFPKTMQRLDDSYPHLQELSGKVASRPNIKAYLESERRIPFNEFGIFRHYPELEA